MASLDKKTQLILARRLRDFDEKHCMAVKKALPYWNIPIFRSAVRPIFFQTTFPYYSPMRLQSTNTECCNYISKFLSMNPEARRHIVEESFSLTVNHAKNKNRASLAPATTLESYRIAADHAALVEEILSTVSVMSSLLSAFCTSAY